MTCHLVNRVPAGTLALTLALGLPGDPVLAQQAPGELDRMIRDMEQISSRMTGGIVDVTRTFLVTMATIEFAWALGKSAIQGEGLAAILTKLITRIVIVGLFFLLLDFGPALVRLVIDSAIAIAGIGGIAAVPSPSTVLGQALNMVGRLLGELSFLSPAQSLGLVLCAIAVVITAAAMAAMIVMVYAELFLVAVTGLIGLGFGGLDATRDIAMNYIRMLLGKGLKLLTLLVVNGMVMATLERVFAPGADDIFSALQILIVQIVGLVLLLQLPTAVESLASGGGSNAGASIAGGFAGSMAGRAMMTAGAVGAGAAYGGARGGVTGTRAALGTGGLKGLAEEATTGGAWSAVKKAGPVLTGVATGTVGGAVSAVGGEGPHRQAAKDVLNFLNRDKD